MTDVTIKRQGKSIISVECDGHTGYGCEGEDIVCAALSSIVQTALLGLLNVAGINVDYTTDAQNGYLKAIIPTDISQKQREFADVILDTMLLGVGDLYEGYSDFINLEVE